MFIVRKAEIVTKLILNMSRVSLARVYWSIDLRNQHFTTSIATSQSKTVVHALFSRFEFRTLRYRFSASTKAIQGYPLTQVRYPRIYAHSMFWWHSEYFGGQRKCFRSCGVTITPSSKRIGPNSSHCWTVLFFPTYMWGFLKNPHIFCILRKFYPGIFRIYVGIFWKHRESWQKQRKNPKKILSKWVKTLKFSPAAL